MLEIGSNFTATCVIVDAEDLTAEDLYWNLSKSTVPEEHYTKINRTAVSVTIAVTGEKTEWLYCHGRRVSHQGRDGLTHGIVLKKACGFAPPPLCPWMFCLLMRMRVLVRPSGQAWECVV